MRTALHVGPVGCYTNPVTGHKEFIGAHVGRAARIEPGTPAGQVYASEAFAAIASARGVEVLRCEYTGQFALAKNSGKFATDHVRCGRAARPEPRR